MSFTYYVIKNEDVYGKLKNDGSMIDYVYGPEPSKIWWRNLWTAPKPMGDNFDLFYSTPPLESLWALAKKLAR